MEEREGADDATCGSEDGDGGSGVGRTVGDTIFLFQILTN